MEENLPNRLQLICIDERRLASCFAVWPFAPTTDRAGFMHLGRELWLSDRERDILRVKTSVMIPFLTRTLPLVNHIKFSRALTFRT